MVDMDITEIWTKTLESLKENISPVGFNVHMKVTEPVSMLSSSFTISVPTSINKNLIEYRYKKFIESTLERVTGQKLSLKIIVQDNDAKQDTTENNSDDRPQNNEDVFASNEMSLYSVNPKYTFDNFVVGPSNLVAYESAKRLAEYPGKIDNPLFIYGNSGLGKTHLMHAIGNRIKEKYPNSNIIYVTIERWTNEYVTALREYTTNKYTNTMEKFRSKYRAADVLLVDDVQFLEKKEGVQEEFFHTFNELFSLNKQIVITSDRRPADLTTLTDRMRTRFGQGFTIDISVPNFETRIAILQNKALEHNIEIEEDILEYIAENIRSSIRELEGALLKVISMSEITGKDITMEFVEETIKSIISANDTVKITPEKIIKKVSVYYNINENDITGKIKTKDIAIPRQVAMYLCKKMLGMNDTSISKEFSKDRSTVTHNIKKIESELGLDESLDSAISYIMKDLESM